MLACKCPACPCALLVGVVLGRTIDEKPSFSLSFSVADGEGWVFAAFACRTSSQKSKVM